jgi:GNAT superfamily N-acetyltransferase
MKLMFRKAKWRDIGQLVKLDTTAPSDPKRKRAIKSWVAQHQCHAAWSGKDIVGYAALTRNFFHMDFVEMLMVHADHRRKGVGTALLRHLATKAKSNKFWTSTNRSNKPMQRLLKQEGFIRSGIIQNLDPGDPELVFVKVR